MGVAWEFEYVAPAEHGWLIRATNKSAFSAQLNIARLEFYMRDGSVPRLDYLTAPFVNSGETIDLKFSVKFEGKAQTDGGILSIGIFYPVSGEFTNIYYSDIELPNLRARNN